MHKLNSLNKIKPSRVLLSVESYNKEKPLIPKWTTAVISFLSLSITTFFLYLISKPEDKIFILVIMAVFMTIAMFTAVYFIPSKEVPLVITENGICVGRYLSESWDNISEYGWVSVHGFLDTQCRNSGEQTCLFIIEKSDSNKSKKYIMNKRNKSLFGIENGYKSLARKGIFFNSAQVREVDKIFHMYGITKTL